MAVPDKESFLAESMPPPPRYLPCVWFGVVWVGLAPTLILGMAPTFVLFGCWVRFVLVSCLIQGLQRVGANPSLVWMNGLE